MASSYLEVGSAGLTELKEDLTSLSQSLHQLFELMNVDMRRVGEAWRDGKYEEFVSGYKPQIQKCENISERYSEWCKRVLEPAIAECIAYEKSDVGGDGSATSSAGSGVSSTDSAPADSIGSAFNMGGKRELSSSEKAQRFREASDKIKNSKPRPQGSGFSTPQNERHYSPQFLNGLYNGKQR